MARKPKRDLTAQKQLARGPVDLPFLMLTLLLMGIGLIMVFSASYASAYYDADVSTPLYYIRNQSIYAAGGVVAMYLISKINYQTFRALSIPGIAVAVVVLLMVYTPFGVTINQVRRWVRIAGIQFQPSEVAKVAVILFFSARLSKRGSRKPLHFSPRSLAGRILNWLERIGFLELIPYGLVLGVICLLVVKEPHMSGTILILAGAAAVLFAGGIHMGWFVVGGALAASLLTFIITMTPYMNSRIQLWQDPWSDYSGAGFQIIQSLYAIASGGLLGRGLGNSMQKYLYVPEPENDFIFAIVVEELGYIGAAFVLLLFALLIIRGYWLALHARDRFGALTIVGIITLLAVQVFLNISVVTNLLPTTGIPLPFFSYGGTALMIQLAEMGVVLSVSRQIPAPKKD